MAEMNTIYDASREIVGIFRFGVAWSRKPKARLGEYDEHRVYDNEGKVLATFDGSKVTSQSGDVIGELRESELFKNDIHVGSFIGTPSAGAAALALLFSGLQLPLYNKPLQPIAREDARSG